MNETSHYYHPRSLFTPFFLIAIGVFFLLGSIGKISGHTMLLWFAHYWPALLIAWGMIKLLEHSWARKAGHAAPRIGAGGVVFLIFLIMSGIAAFTASRVNWGAMDMDMDHDWGGWNFFGTQYEFTENLSQPVGAGAPVKILGGRGNISITASPDNQAHAFVHKYVRTESQNEAN